MRVRSRTWTAIRSLSYSTLSLGITRFWNFSNPLSGCKVTKFDPPFAPRRGARGVKKIWGCQILAPKGPIFAIKHFWNYCNSLIYSKVAKFDPPCPPSGGRGVEKILGGEKIWGDKFWGHTSFGIFQIRWKTQICEANLCFPIFTNSSSLQLHVVVERKFGWLFILFHLLSWAHWLSAPH